MDQLSVLKDGFPTYKVLLSEVRTNPIPYLMARRPKPRAQRRNSGRCDLQLIDSRIDRLRVVRGELPLEVEDLEDELAGLAARLERLNEELEASSRNRAQGVHHRFGAMISALKSSISVRNNREFESLNKEIEYRLQIQLKEKRIKESEAQLEQKSEIITEVKTKHDHRAEDLKAKQAELDEIIAETRRGGDPQQLERQAVRQDRRPPAPYVPPHPRWCQERHGCGADRARGQRRQLHRFPRILDVGARKRIIVDEHSGRILVDQELAVEEQEKVSSWPRSQGRRESLILIAASGPVSIGRRWTASTDPARSALRRWPG